MNDPDLAPPRMRLLRVAGVPEQGVRNVALAWTLGSLVFLAGCAPAIIAVGVGGAAMVATDRRATEIQVDDDAIQLKITTRANELYGKRIQLSVNAYNGAVLLTGEVPDQGAWASLGGLAKDTAKVRLVYNELVVGPLSSFLARSNDSFITSKVKSRFVEVDKFPAIAVKVVTERGVVYLMGIVSRTEGDAAGSIAASTADVVRVVKYFDYSS